MANQPKCDACGATFEDTQALRKHVEAEHGGPEQAAGADQGD